MGGYIGAQTPSFAVDPLPSGVIVMWSGSISAIPSGWYLCDGSNGTPNLTGKFVVHADADSGGTYAPNATGGSDSVTLSEAQLPSHSHSSGTLATASAGNHRHGLNGGTSGGSLKIFGTQTNRIGGIDYQATETFYTSYGGYNMMENTGAHTHTMSGSTASTGSGSSHENRPPYYALAYIMKA